MGSCIYKIEHLEKVLPEMEGRRDVRFKEEVSALSAKLGFLTRRLDEAEKFEWKGTIQRMQTLSLAKYQLVVCVQLLMLILDFVVNLFAEHLGYRNVHFLIMYM
ncbi:unnamed protein product [Darwinula stevensoni]|uniref:Uncharacterized protein n=1 Tax=Darwinula stevensoni TaxID=69355 RepID=A0A7R9A358_9CRUS|nr:unnamed protein product [Darwinula stevensoni]CAG0881419.1 unnamed protein product [Darwinula stevensoni]